MENAVNTLIEFGQQLRDSGLTPGWLLLIGLLFSITLVISLRELTAWYFKIHHVQTDLEEIKKAIARLERKIEQSNLELEAPTQLPVAPLETKNRFTSRPINH